MAMMKFAICVFALAACGLHETSPGSVEDVDRCSYDADGKSHCLPGKFTRLAIASSFTCALGSDGGIYCWGGNSLGELGDGTVTPHAHPARVGATTDWTDVAASPHLACGLKADHSMWCWGSGSNGELGDGRGVSESRPTQVISDKSGVGWKAMSLGLHAVCGLHVDGSIACWGRDRVTSTNLDKPQAVDGNTDWTAISAGDVRCGLRGNPGALYCWGRSFTGELGLGTTTVQPTPARVGAASWRAVETGQENACGIRSDGALLCWGNNPFNRTSLQYGNTPQQIGTATDWQSVSLSAWGIIGLRAGGAFAWGRNFEGSPFPPMDSEIAEPTQVPAPNHAWSDLRSGNAHTCGLSGGHVYCWGAIGDGMLGNGVTTTLARPAQIGSDHFTALSGSQGQCGLRSDGALMCWGNDLNFGVGFGNTDPVTLPTRLGTQTYSAVAGSSSIAPIASMCAIRGGQLVCWGDNELGQLGIGNLDTPQLGPVAVNVASVPAGTQWAEVAVGGHTCAITSTGTLWCWGANDSGQLGNGTAGTPPVLAPSAPLAGTWLHVAVAEYDVPAAMTCGIQADHTLWCWGNDQPFTATQHVVPTQVGSASSWVSLSMGAGFNAAGNAATICAVQSNGTLWCWGQWLGDGTLDSSTVPVQVGNDTDWSSVSVGGEICATKTGGTLWCWANTSLLGDGSPLALDAAEIPVPATRPTRIGNDKDWRVVETSGSGGGISCATKADGTLWCWGSEAAPIPGFTTTPALIH
jgi:alpha-tubulin suppressor-like RCC1 family protein